MAIVDSKGPAARYSLAVLVAVSALALRWLLQPLLGTANPYHTIWAAVVLAAWYCGVGPAIVSMIIGLLGVWFWFVTPVHSFAITNPADLFGILAYVVLSGLLIGLGESNRRTNLGREAAERKLRQAKLHLEDTVNARTEELRNAVEGLHELSHRLMQLQDDERRHLARELHDSVGQLLAAMSMNIASVKSELHKLSPTARKAVDENAEMLEQITSEVRTISHLLHPPLLDEVGIGSAIQWYVQQFGERSKIDVAVELPESLGRFPSDLETAMFRIVQECLTNVHRHSHSDTAMVRIVQNHQSLSLEIRDSGKGIPPEKRVALTSGKTGVGLCGMQERVNQLRGTLDIQSNEKGTVVTAIFPIPPLTAADTSKSVEPKSSNPARDEREILGVNEELTQSHDRKAT